MQRKPRWRVSGTFFVLSQLSLQDVDGFSCVISKKTAPTAVERNRAKRRARTAFLAAGGGRGAYVIGIRKPALAAPHHELVRELSKLLAREQEGRR